MILEKPRATAYVLEDHVGFLLRQVTQRHVAIFAELIGDDITPPQFAALAKLRDVGACSQNRLGRLTAMDVATIKGVVDRLSRRGLIDTRADPQDGRRLIVALTPEGAALVERLIPAAQSITRTTLSPLSAAEQQALIDLLKKLR